MRVPATEGCYAWWNAPIDGLPEFTCPVPHYNVQVVPGMGQWVLISLKQPMSQRDLPPGVILCANAVRLFDESIQHERNSDG